MLMLPEGSDVVSQSVNALNVYDLSAAVQPAMSCQVAPLSAEYWKSYVPPPRSVVLQEPSRVR